MHILDFFCQLFFFTDMFAFLHLQVGNVLLIVMHSAHLVAHRKAFQQSMEDVLTLSREQTSSQPLIAGALEELKVLMAMPEVLLHSHETFKIRPHRVFTPYFQYRSPLQLFALILKNRPIFFFFLRN